MYVCICAAVSEARVQECITEGARTAEEIGDRCRAGVDCGTCLDHLDDLIEERDTVG